MRDRRKFIRKRVISTVTISHSVFGEVEGHSRDISDNGIFVLAQELPELPKGAHINLQLMDSSNPHVYFNTRVVRLNESGVGLAIVDYEIDGERFSIDELRRQWILSYPERYS